MSNNCIFFVCTTLSIAIHSVLLWALPYHVIKPLVAAKPLEVSYEQSVPARETRTSPSYAPDLAVLKKQEKPFNRPQSVRDFMKTEIFKKDKAVTPVPDPLLEGKEVSLKKVTDLPDVPGEIARTPEYKNYYQIIRERIRRLAYYNYKKVEEGEVFLTFSISAEGALLNLSINDEKSAKSDYLRDIAARSVKDAAPYPTFPEKLKNSDKLAFNVIISFELK
jgi:outer membrane biosynthesis protein TonB